MKCQLHEELDTLLLNFEEIMSAKMIRAAIVVFFVQWTLSDSLFAQSNVAEDQRTLQGRWKVTNAINAEKKKIRSDELQGWQLTFGSKDKPKDKPSVTWENQPKDQPRFSATYNIDARTPGNIDFTLLDGAHRNEILRGSYLLEVDNESEDVKLAIALPSPEQPPRSVERATLLPVSQRQNFLKKGVLYLFLDKISE